jgi:hypothetical protein
MVCPIWTRGWTRGWKLVDVKMNNFALLSQFQRQENTSWTIRTCLMYLNTVVLVEMRSLELRKFVTYTPTARTSVELSGRGGRFLHWPFILLSFLLASILPEYNHTKTKTFHFYLFEYHMKGTYQENSFSSFFFQRPSQQIICEYNCPSFSLFHGR